MEKSGPTPSWPAGPAGAAKEEHLLLLRNATTSGLLLDIHTFWFVSVYFWSQNVRDSRSPSYLAVSQAGGLVGGVWGKRDLRCCFYHPPWQLGWTQRLGWKDCCCGWRWLDLLAISRMLCSVAVSGVMLPLMPDLGGRGGGNRHGKKWPYTLRFRSVPGRLAAGSARVAQEEHLLLLRNATAARLLLDCPYIRVGWYRFTLHAFRRQLRAWPGGGGGGARSWKEMFLSTARRRRRAWPEGGGGVFGPGSEGAAAGRSSGRGVCFLRLSPLTLCLARRRRRRGAHLDRGLQHRLPFAICYVRLSPPTSGLARRRRRRGAQLEGDISVHSSRRLPGGVGGGALSWIGSLLSTPLDADFEPGPEGAAVGRSAGRGVCFVRLSPPTSGKALRAVSQKSFQGGGGLGGGGGCNAEYPDSYISQYSLLCHSYSTDVHRSMSGCCLRKHMSYPVMDSLFYYIRKSWSSQWNWQ